MTHLNEFLTVLNEALPDICADKDLVSNLPYIFRNPYTITRMRARKQAPKHFYIHPHYYYLKADVISWFREKYQSNEPIEREEKQCCLK